MSVFNINFGTVKNVGNNLQICVATNTKVGQEMSRQQLNEQPHFDNIEYHPESEITITAGATQAIFTAIAAFVKEEDEVIIFTPAYDCYQPAIELVGGKPVFVQMTSPDYKINWEEVKKLISQKTRMIIITLLVSEKW